MRWLTLSACLALAVGALADERVQSTNEIATVMEAASDQPSAAVFPTLSLDQRRPRLSTNEIDPPELDYVDPAGPGPGNNGAGACETDRSCRTRSGNQCKEFVGSKCYTWLTGDGVQKCSAC